MKPKHSKAKRENCLDRGVSTLEEAQAWFSRQNIEEIECVVPDLAGVARGKIMPVRKFLGTPSMNLPLAVFYQTIAGEFPAFEGSVTAVQADTDIFLTPDFATLAEEAPRQVLRRVLALYAEKGWNPIVAPEIEFYLVERNTDPDYPLRPPVGRSGRPETGRQGYSISAVNEFDALFEDMYEYSERQGLEIDTLIHESGVAQMEINLRHGHPLELADQVFMMKRTIREAALEHEIYATFMAKPMASEPGSAMHIHQSIVDRKGRNLFSDEDGNETELFHGFIGGQQTYLPAIMAILAPYVNSSRRIARDSGAPVNTQWGYDNRTCGLRVPPSDPANRRLENRIPSSDANPYLAIAAVLASGYLGMVENLKPSAPVATDAGAEGVQLPRSLSESLRLFEACQPLVEILGPIFCQAYNRVKQAEYETFMRTISPWEREFLLLNV